MEPKKGVIEKSKSVRDMHHLRLMSLLQELERDHGRRKTAEILGVDRRTLDASLDEGALSRRIRKALEKALQSGVGSAAAEQRDRNDKLEDSLKDLTGVVEELGREMRVGRRAAEDANRATRDEQSKAHRELERRLAALESDGGSGRKERTPDSQPRKKTALRREYPDLVTLEPAEDDEEVFGEAWSLIGEWRELKASHPNGGRGLGWLLDEERLRMVELALLEEHGMTLPPEKQPLRGFDRDGQVNWRRSALYDTRRALRKWALLRWVMRWWRERRKQG